MLAYADGEDIESIYLDNCSLWHKDYIPSFDWKDFDYRVKLRPKYRPFKDVEECWQEMQKHEPFGWLKRKNEENGYAICGRVDRNCIFTGDFDEYTFADGAPFGIKEEE